jgi:Ran GTPase-activating protein (RanGAP) involved in mRNA processing and transport
VSLALRGCEFGAPALKRLAGAAWFPHLQHLDVSGGPLVDAGQIDALLGAHTGHLRSLNMSRREMEPDAAAALAGAPSLAGLERLVLSNNPLGAAGARYLAEGDFGGLRRLELYANGIGDTGLAALLAVPWFASVTHLELAGNSITESGARLLAESPGVRNLVHLDLSSNLIGAAGLDAVVRSENLAHLTTLRIRANGVGDAGALALVESGAPSRLRVLDLGHNRLGARGGRALAAARWSAALLQIGVPGNPLSPGARALLKATFGSRLSL